MEEPELKVEFKEPPTRPLKAEERWWLTFYGKPEQWKPYESGNRAMIGELPKDFYNPYGSSHYEQWQRSEMVRKAEEKQLHQQLDSKGVASQTGELNWQQLHHLSQLPRMSWPPEKKVLGPMNYVALGPVEVPLEETSYGNYSQTDWIRYYLEMGLFTDGSHHKQWALEQALQLSYDTPMTASGYQHQRVEDGRLGVQVEAHPQLGAPSAAYVEWLEKIQEDDGEGNTYSFEPGIPP